MSVRATWVKSHLTLTVILVLAITGLGSAEVSVEQPLVDHAALSPPARPAGPAPFLERPLDSPGSAPAQALPVVPAPVPRPFIGGDRPASVPSDGGVDGQIRLRRFPDYPIVENDRVQYFLDRFTGDRREIIGRWLGRSSLYLEMVRRTFRNRGLPEDLAFTAMIESGFDPAAVSRVGAKGLWQFMTRTARLYGLRVDRWVDERLDPEKSTVAAAAYLGDLYAQFGSWFLAQAAYNAGEVKVIRAIRLSRTTDFWELARGRHLRKETKDFVPSIQAITLIARDPNRYGFEVAADDPLEFETVQAPPATDLRLLARGAGLAPATLRTLNPQLRRGVTPPGAFYAVKVPPGAKDTVLAILVARADASVHVVRRDETLSEIARKYGVSVTDIVRWNKLADLDRIRPGDRIRVARARDQVDQGGFR